MTSTSSPSDTLAAWMAREAELRGRIRGTGIARPEQFFGLTGLQSLQAMMDGDIPFPPMSKTLDFLVVEVSPGQAVVQGRPMLAHYNPLSCVHGGWAATLLDTALACSVHTLLPVGKAYTTIELKVNYVKALTEDVPLVRAIGNIIHQGNRTATADGRLVGPDGTLYAHASTTCIIFDAAKGRSNAA